MKEISFDERYVNAPAELRETLHSFRRSHPYTQVNAGGLPWQYISSGAGKQALLMLGGGISTGETSFRSILRMEDRYRIISPTYPASGDMSKVAEGLSEIIQREGFDRAHVWGHSLGAAVAHVFARLKPECVDKLVLDGFGLYTTSHVRAARWFFKLPHALLLAYYRSRLKKLIKGGGGDPETLFYNIYLEEVMTSLHTRESLMSQFKLLIDVFDRAGEYRVFEPVKKPGKIQLILTRDDKGFTNEERQALLDSYPDAKVHFFESGGHLAGFTRREEFDRVLDDFLMQG